MMRSSSCAARGSVLPVKSTAAPSRQYLPQANKAWEGRFPGMFRVTDGLLRTEEVSGPGLGAPEIQSL